MYQDAAMQDKRSVWAPGGSSSSYYIRPVDIDQNYTSSAASGTCTTLSSRCPMSSREARMYEARRPMGTIR